MVLYEELIKLSIAINPDTSLSVYYINLTGFDLENYLLSFTDQERMRGIHARKRADVVSTRSPFVNL